MKLLNNISAKITKVGGRTLLKVSKHSPTILMVVGISSVVGAAVLACRATLKAGEVLDGHQEKLEQINEAGTSIDVKDYSEKDFKRDLTVAYVQTGVDFVKLYGPAVMLMLFGVSCLLKSHSIMNRRNVALMAAYKALDEGFAAYRKRVVDEYGEKKDYMLRHGLTAEEVSYTEVGEDGKVKKLKKTVLSEPTETSIYARLFDSKCSEWVNDPQYNLMLLKNKEQHFNDLLKTRGNVFLNEVYDALGIERCPEGCIVGWVWGEHGDNKVDFGLNRDDQLVTNFINGYEKRVLLDFNVDGVVYDKI